MASYKIYFLDFCHKNSSSTAANQPAKLQNAIMRAVFMRKVIFSPQRGQIDCCRLPWNNRKNAAVSQLINDRSAAGRSDRSRH